LRPRRGRGDFHGQPIPSQAQAVPGICDISAFAPFVVRGIKPRTCRVKPTPVSEITDASGRMLAAKLRYPRRPSACRRSGPCQVGAEPEEPLIRQGCGRARSPRIRLANAPSAAVLWNRLEAFALRHPDRERMSEEILTVQVAALLKVADKTVYATVQKGGDPGVQGARPVAIPAHGYGYIRQYYRP